MDQSPAPAPGRRTFGMLGGLGPGMTAFVVVDALLLAAFLVMLVVFVSQSLGGSSDSAVEPVSPAVASGVAASAAPSSTSAGEDTVKFSLPSGNISCEITPDAATCTIANSSATPPVDAKCSGVIGVKLTVTAKGASMPCVKGAPPGVAPAGTPVLEYGQSKSAGDFTCSSSSTGVKCLHVPSGKGFKLARAGSELL